MRPKHGHFCPVVFQIPQTSFCVIDILALPLGEHVDSAIQLVLCFGQVLVTTAVAMAGRRKLAIDTKIETLSQRQREALVSLGAYCIIRQDDTDPRMSLPS